jgi:hydroxyethylthiazole kinase-like uncharacterized protein yjeF
MSSALLLTAKQAKTLDQKLRTRFGISTLVLMENAGAAVAKEILKLPGGKKRVAIFCGKGNNGGDGLVCARHLLAHGIKPDIFLIGKTADVANEARANLNILIKLKQRITRVDNESLKNILNKIGKYDIIIDAIFGVGLSGRLEGVFKDLIGAINRSDAYTLAVDIPSGLDATTGKILGCCIKADKTVTFIARKAGMTIAHGPGVCGRIVIDNLGIPI